MIHTFRLPAGILCTRSCFDHYAYTCLCVYQLHSIQILPIVPFVPCHHGNIEWTVTNLWPSQPSLTCIQESHECVALGLRLDDATGRDRALPGNSRVPCNMLRYGRPLIPSPLLQLKQAWSQRSTCKGLKESTGRIFWIKTVAHFNYVRLWCWCIRINLCKNV